MDDRKCWRCNDLGLDGGCSICGKKIDSGTTKFFTEEEKESIHTVNKDLKIWDSQILIDKYSYKSKDKGFVLYTKVMDALMSNARNGILPKTSVMFISERGMGKHTFYDCISDELSKNGFTCFGPIDHSEYLRTSIVQSEKPFRKGQISMDDIVYSDLFCMEVDVTNRMTALRAIESVLMKRGNLKKPTFIISNCSLSELSLSKGDSSNFRYYGDANNIRLIGDLDSYRYCKILNSAGNPKEVN